MIKFTELKSFKPEILVEDTDYLLTSKFPNILLTVNGGLKFFMC